MSRSKNPPCKCLLNEAGEKDLAKNIMEYISTLNEEIKASDALYEQRLSICKSCCNLSNGTCAKCGCYVEMRAAIKNNRCPSEEKFW